MSGAVDERWMRAAIELAWRCPPSDSAFAVGAVIVDAAGDEVARGFSREGGDPVVHAEEAALGKLAPGEPRLAGATIYSTLEPCSRRRSRPRTCTQLIIAAGLARVVIAWREPALFVADAQGAELLARAGITVTELPELGADAAAPNRHLLLARLPRRSMPLAISAGLTFPRTPREAGCCPREPMTAKLRGLRGNQEFTPRKPGPGPAARPDHRGPSAHRDARGRRRARGEVAHLPGGTRGGCRWRERPQAARPSSATSLGYSHSASGCVMVCGSKLMRIGGGYC